MAKSASRIIQFNNSEMEKLARNPDGKYYSDKECRGLKARADTDHNVTFTLVKRPKGGGKKVYTTLGVYDPEHFDVKAARLEAGDAKYKLRDAKHAPKDTKTLDMMIEETEQGRLSGKSAIKVKKKDGLPTDWAPQKRKLKRMVAAILHRDIELLTVDEIENCKEDHLREIAKKKGKTIKVRERLNDKPLRQPCSMLRQVLTLAIKQGRQQPSILDACETRLYDDCPRFLLPGEWQRTATALDYLPHSGGLVPRFLLATAARLNTALNMKWDDLSDPPKREWHATHPVRKWRTRTKGQKIVTIYLTGEALRIIDHFAEQKENSKDEKDRERLTVFPKKVIQMWRKYGYFYQRKIEEVVGTVPFNRKDLRRTLATYMKYAGGSQLTAAAALTHSNGPRRKRHSDDDAPEVTKVYTKDDKMAGDFLGNATLSSNNNGVMYSVVAAHVQVQALFKQIERSEHTPAVEDIEAALDDEGDNMAEMIVKSKVDKAFVWIKSPAEHAKWVKQAKLAEWGSKLEPELKAELAKEQSEGRVKRIAKKKATALRAEKSGSAVAAA